MNNEIGVFIDKYYPNYWRNTVISSTLVIILFLVSIYLVVETDNSFGLYTFLFSQFLIVIPYAYYRSIKEEMTDASLMNFAEEKGFSWHRGKSKFKHLTSSFVRTSNKSYISKLIEGKYNNSHVRIFTFSSVTEITYEKNVGYTTLERQYNGDVINIILDSRVHGINTLSPSDPYDKEYINKGLLMLEGNFNKYFNIYTPQGYKIETLQILTPDIMEKLIEKSHKYNFEFNLDKLYIFAMTQLTKKEDLDEILDFSDYLISKLGPKLSKLKNEYIKKSLQK
ncbi:MAG: DUF3137 domain-containing protein [bacterium]